MLSAGRKTAGRKINNNSIDDIVRNFRTILSMIIGR